MKEIIEQLVNIDKKSKKIINKCEEKEENLENYITIELEKRKSEIKAKYKYKIDFLKSECDKDAKQKKEDIKQNSQKIIKEIQNEYNLKKYENIEEIIRTILT